MKMLLQNNVNIKQTKQVTFLKILQLKVDGNDIEDTKKGKI